jgi:hypothetical protein
MRARGHKGTHERRAASLCDRLIYSNNDRIDSEHLRGDPLDHGVNWLVMGLIRRYPPGPHDRYLPHPVDGWTHVVEKAPTNKRETRGNMMKTYLVMAGLAIAGHHAR